MESWEVETREQKSGEHCYQDRETGKTNGSKQFQESVLRRNQRSYFMDYSYRRTGYKSRRR